MARPASEHARELWRRFVRLDERTLTLVHLAAATAVAIVTVIALGRADLGRPFPEATERAAFARGLALASLLASLIAVGLGIRTGEQRRMLLLDAATWPVIAIATAAAMLLTLPEALAGITYVLGVAGRFAPLVARFVTDPQRGIGTAFALAFGVYVALSIWTIGGVRASGDAPHYLLATEALRRGSLDLMPLYIGPLFELLTGSIANVRDLEIHTVRVGEDLRLAQGYFFSALLLPGWVAGGRAGATVVLALIAAGAMAQTLLLLRETVGDRRLTRACWALFAFSWPFAALATHVYPEVLAALITVTVFRLLFTAPVRRPLLAGLLGGLVLLLVPRHAVVPLLLLPFAFRHGVGRPFAGGLAAMLALTAVMNLAVFENPLPYAGYVAGIGTYGDPLHVRIDVGLLGMLFDRAFGLAGTAPWVFIGAIGIIPLLRKGASWVLVALAVVVGGRVILSTFRLWEGGWGPPNRYVVDVLPLWMPFVIAGISHLRNPLVATAAASLILLSGITTAILHADPSLSYTKAENRVVEVMRPYAPLPQALLPSFRKEPDEAHLRAIAAGVLVLGLLAAGWQASRARTAIGAAWVRGGAGRAEPATHGILAGDRPEPAQ